APSSRILPAFSLSTQYVKPAGLEPRQGGIRLEGTPELRLGPAESTPGKRPAHQILPHGSWRALTHQWQSPALCTDCDSQTALGSRPGGAVAVSASAQGGVPPTQRRQP